MMLGLCISLLYTLWAGAAMADRDFTYLSKYPTSGEYLVIDTRPLGQCEVASLPGARCLPARELFGQGGRLAAFASIRWLLGAMGLSGEEHALVIGRPASRDRDVVAAILFLAGQKRVSVLLPPVRPADTEKGGIVRGTAREVVYIAPMRDRWAITHGELVNALGTAEPPALIDGRPETEYWGDRGRAVRGGHIPGADSLPLASLVSPTLGATLMLPAAADPVVYGNDPTEGLALFATLNGRYGLPVRVYLDGWARWASDGSLPADAASHGPRPMKGKKDQ